LIVWLAAGLLAATIDAVITAPAHLKLAKFIQPPPAVKASSAEAGSYALSRAVATPKGPRPARAYK
jgi:hypothetical protein